MAIGDVISNYEQEIKFITGFAGSGKSTKLAELATKDTLVLTPTHKAARVLNAKGLDHVYTIHSVLKLVPTINKDYDPTKKQRMQKLTQIGTTDLSDIDTIFIDEFSMLSMDILDLLLNLLPDYAKVIVFGDPYQLSPVSGEPIDPLFYTEDIEELTIQHRAEAPEVVETFMRFMTYIKTQDNSMSLKLNPAIKQGTIRTFNPDTDRILAFTNNKVSQLNYQVAEHLGLPEEYSVGEKLTANQMDCVMSSELSSQTIYPGCMSKGRLMPPGDLNIARAKIESDMAKYRSDKYVSKYPTCSIELEGSIYNVRYDTHHYQTQQALKNKVDIAQRVIYSTHNIPEDMRLSQWCKENRDLECVKARGTAWAEYLAHSSLVFALQRPFATTVHKSQGSEFSTVYIAQSDIKKSIQRGYYMNYARLMYVALSRAVNKVIVID